jgi:hypothetical protein
VGQGWGPISGWLRWLCLVAAGMMVVRTGPIQALGVALYAGILVLGARRGAAVAAISRG